MSLDFQYTCGDIDAAIKESSKVIKSEISEINPDIDCSFSIQYIINTVVEGFERIRSLNSDMRDQANYQISELEEEVESLKYELAQVEASVENKQDKIYELENEIFELRNQLDEYSI